MRFGIGKHPRVVLTAERALAGAERLLGWRPVGRQLHANRAAVTLALEDQARSDRFWHALRIRLNALAAGGRAAKSPRENAVDLSRGPSREPLFRAPSGMSASPCPKPARPALTLGNLPATLSPDKRIGSHCSLFVKRRRGDVNSGHGRWLRVWVVRVSDGLFRSPRHGAWPSRCWCRSPPKRARTDRVDQRLRPQRVDQRSRQDLAGSPRRAAAAHRGRRRRATADRSGATMPSATLASSRRMKTSASRTRR